jgi:hypothetical protein
VLWATCSPSPAAPSSGYRNHDTGRLVDLVDTTGPDALLNERYGLLFLRTWPQDPASVFSLQPADQPPHPCS